MHIITKQDRAMLRAFERQRGNARRRGITWYFLFPEWRAWWLEDNRWARRGRNRGMLGMCRFGDEGPYSPDNVYAGTPADNQADISSERRKAAAHKTWERIRMYGGKSHLENRERHPRGRRCATPHGEFANASLAADYIGLTRQRVGQLCRKGLNGWRYV